MQVRVEDLNSVKKKLHIEIPAEEVTQRLDDAYKNLRKNARIKGFRQGKAPRSVLERLYKKDVHVDVTGQLIQDSFQDAIKETQLDMLHQPQIDPPELIENSPYKYEATVEIHPKISDIDFKGIKLKRSLYEVSESEVENQIKLLQAKFPDHEKVVEERAAQLEDIVLIDYEGFRDGKPIEEAEKTENFIMKLGKSVIAKEMDDAIIGMNIGETKTVTVTIPSNYRNPKLSNQTIDFQTRLNEIREEKPKEINDEFAKLFGPYETLNDLKTAIRNDLEKGYQKRIEQELHEQAMQALIEASPFEVPESLVKIEMDAMLAETDQHFAHYNTTMEDVGLSRDKFEIQYRDVAEKQAKRHLILKKIIEQENLTMSDEEMDEGFHQMAKALGQPFEEVKEYYQRNTEQLSYYRYILLEKKAIELILSNSEIEDRVPEAIESSENQDSDDSANSTE